MGFHEGFVWGAATASYQVEGAAFEDGRGLSVWDAFCRKEGAIWSGHDGDVACDHYHHYAEDVRLMQEIGIHAYRFSIGWPRVVPGGTGKVNEAGLDFYDRLVDCLAEAHIAPFVTLFHWDYPYDLYCRGGWLNRDSADWFADYVRIVVERLSDRVSHWITLNEPQCFIGLGHGDGVHAPGLRLSRADMLVAAHNSLRAHGKAVQAVRAASRKPCQVGYAPVGVVKIPATEAPEDVQAARAAMFSVSDPSPWNNTWWMDPVFLGRYPEDGLALFGESAPPIEPGDMDLIQQPLDFLGVNIYSGQVVQADENGKAIPAPEMIGRPLTAFRWSVTPEALRWGPRFFDERYALPIYITENGLSNVDWVAVDGQVHDPQRIDFTTRYLGELSRGIEEGADVRGYFHWSLLDNFEWAEGYKERFGLVFVDYPTGRRIPKDSAKWYGTVIRSNGAVIDSLIP